MKRGAYTLPAREGEIGARMEEGPAGARCQPNSARRRDGYSVRSAMIEHRCGRDERLLDEPEPVRRRR